MDTPTRTPDTCRSEALDNARPVTRLRRTSSRRIAAQAAHCIIPTTIAESATGGGRVTSDSSTPSTRPTALVLLCGHVPAPRWLSLGLQREGRSLPVGWRRSNLKVVTDGASCLHVRRFLALKTGDRA